MVSISHHARAKAAFAPAPSLTAEGKTEIVAAATVPEDAGMVGFLVGTEGDPPRELGLDRASLMRAGFEGKAGQTLVIARAGLAPYVAVGTGARGQPAVYELRNAAASFARAARKHDRLALMMEPSIQPTAEAVQAMAEGASLARYRFRSYRPEISGDVGLKKLTLVTKSKDVQPGIDRGSIVARAVGLTRDLANAPATLLNARRLAEIAEELGKVTGLGVEIFDGEALLAMGCGAMLGVNAGSVEPPRMIRLTYRPRGEPTGHLCLVGKGIMYDSGGISLKPNDLVHATMKGDMSGAASVLASMTALHALGCTTAVTGYMMCTDNMPSGTAMKLGDVLTVRGGTSVEVLNTDAEGRLVMADGLVLCTEQDPRPDAIIDIATLTGACQRALGRQRAGLFANNPALREQLEASAERTDEAVWFLPLDHRYRKELDSDLADLKNVGGDDAGAITAALFLEEFIAGIPWAHIDIAGTARAEMDDGWRNRGATGFGTSLLIDFATRFRPPAPTRH